jgi:hypothetical protein
VLREVIIVVVLFTGYLVSRRLTILSFRELIDQRPGKYGWLNQDVSNYTDEGKKLRRRARWFSNLFFIAFWTYIVFASHVISCAGKQPHGTLPQSTLGG